MEEERHSECGSGNAIDSGEASVGRMRRRHITHAQVVEIRNLWKDTVEVEVDVRESVE